MKEERTTDPAGLPISVELVEEVLNIASGDTPLKVANLMGAATDDLETNTDRALVDQGWTVTLDRFPTKTIFLPKGPVVTIDTFTYVSETGVDTALVEGTDYSITTIGELIRLDPIGSWPSPVTDQDDVVSVEYTVGLGADDTEMPDWVKNALLLKIQGGYDSCFEDFQEAYDSAIGNRKLYFDYTINDGV